MLRIVNLRVAVTNQKPLRDIVEKKFPFLKGELEQIHVVRKAVDARRKGNITFVYTLFLEVKQELALARFVEKEKDVSFMNLPKPPDIVKGKKSMPYRPVVVGFGPAGMLAALYLAREGYRPIVLERGADADTRTKDVETFWETGKFDPVSNVQFGEGGAGTFSDGKLTTRVNHPRLHEIAEYFVKFGAPKEILFKHKPHVGTDVLRYMVKRLRRQIIDWGGEVRFYSKVTDIRVEDGRIASVTVNDQEELLTNHVFLGVGHSARDTYEMLYERKIQMDAKPFAIGVRIEHPQHLIDQSQYGTEAPEELGLGAADYALIYQDEEVNRAAYTFCMCPGGEVVASASEVGGVVTNGMSRFARDSGVANSALVVSVTPEDFGNHPLDGVEFQRKWEILAYELGGKTYKAPMQLVGDFLAGKATTEIPEGVVTTYRPGIVPSDIRKCLPDFVTDSMAKALPYFGRRLKGFDHPLVAMTGVETRTSAPLRIARLEGAESPSATGLYPIGEGAGYAGGIMSAALDGAEVAIRCMEKWAPMKEGV